jgi:hypothetical protein
MCHSNSTIPKSKLPTLWFHLLLLSLQLKQIGFDNMAYPLMKRICLAPANFILIAKYSNMPHIVSFHFFFERTNGNDRYDLIYYDAILQQENSFMNTNIERINIQQLDELTIQVDWINVFNFSKPKPISLENKAKFLLFGSLLKGWFRLRTLIFHNSFLL